jgi:phytol kinase
LNAAEWSGIAGVLAVLLVALPLIRIVARRIGASPEVARKSVHVALGMTCATFPWVFDRALPVVALAMVATVPLALIRVFPSLKQGVGSALHGIERPSYGEVLFAPAVALVFALADGDVELYLIPVLVLTIADAAGALVGTRWGKRRYGSGEGFKTVEGSVIFCLTALLCGCLPLIAGGRVDLAHALWIGLILGILAMMAEGLSDRGFDNLVIPVGCYFVLDKLMPLEIPALSGRFAVLVALLLLVLAGSRWSTLSGGALLGGALLGYGCAVIADWRFALPLVAVFICHVVTTRKHGLTGKFDHRLDVVLSHSIACLPWVLAVDAGWIENGRALAGVSFAMGAQLAMLDTATRAWVPGLEEMPVRSALKGMLLASLPGLVWLWPQARQLAVPVVVAWVAIWGAALIFQRFRVSYHGHVTGLWIIKGLMALAVSSAALLVS